MVKATVKPTAWISYFHTKKVQDKTIARAVQQPPTWKHKKWAEQIGYLRTWNISSEITPIYA